jgi:tetratricopeptide (TPR) repeat protein
MLKLFAQLQERGVLRVAGLYIAIIWLLLQIADVVFPAFEIPDSVVRYILFAAAAGFPGVLVFAWFFEITDRGIFRESELEEIGAKRLSIGRYMYLTTIGALLLALSISVFFNVQQAANTPLEEPQNLSLLIADIDNQTGDPVFDGALEQALTIGLEGSAFITSFSRPNALKIANKISDGERLDEDRARLVAVREGVKLVLTGSILSKGAGYALTVVAKAPQDGTILAEANSEAEGKLEVLQAVGNLATQVREALGDVTIKRDGLEGSETFSAASIEAVSFYTRAQSLSQNGKDQQAVEFYEKAIAEDPNFGRAYSGWAIATHNLGEAAKAIELWEKTLTLLGGMTERERYRTLGAYYSVATRNYDKAIESYELLVAKYPADAVGHNNLAVSYFYNMQFDKALVQGKNILDIYPKNPLFHSNYALYAMYAGDFATAKAEAEQLLVNDASYYKAYLPIAMAHLAAGDADAATGAYNAMLDLDSRGASTAHTGLADIALLQGDYESAIAILTTAIEEDVATNNQMGQAYKYVALAEAYVGLGDEAAARAVIEKTLELSSALQHRAPAARLFIELGDLERAESLQLELGAKLQRESRAASELIKGRIHLARGENVAAVDALRSSLERLDSWVIHFELGRAYYAAGYFAEALSEFERCKERIGEATAIFLDDMPTFHRTAHLSSWLEKTQQELGIVPAASSE